MGELRDMMEMDLKLRRMSPNTTRSYFFADRYPGRLSFAKTRTASSS
jgi:hypothetical protein